MKVYQINRDDLVPTFYINATFNGGLCLSFLQSIIFQGSHVVLLDVKERCFYINSLLSREYFSHRSE